MSTDLLRLDLRLRRRMVIGTAIGIVVYTLMVIAVYPAMKDDTALNAMTADNPTAAALLGVTGSITSVGGWLNGNLYANFVPLLALMLTIGYGAGAIAGQDEDGTLGLAATLPLSRNRIAAQKGVALGIVSLVVPAATYLALLPGPSFDLHPDWAALGGVSVGVALLGFDIGLLALLVGALTGNRGTALGAATAVAAASYLVSSLAPVIDWVHTIRWTSLFYWTVGDNQIVDGLSWSAVAVLVGVAVVLLAAVIPAFRRLDVH